MTKFIMHGCNGAMGQVITRLAKEDPEVEIVAGIDINDNVDNGYPVFTNMKDCTVAFRRTACEGFRGRKKSCSASFGQHVPRGEYGL